MIGVLNEGTVQSKIRERRLSQWFEVRLTPKYVSDGMSKVTRVPLSVGEEVCRVSEASQFQEEQETISREGEITQAHRKGTVRQGQEKLKVQKLMVRWERMEVAKRLANEDQ